MKFKCVANKICIALLMPALSAGVLFSCGFQSVLPQNVSVNGVEVGGLSHACAAAEIRRNIESELKQKTLTVYSGEREYTFTYPEISYRDNISILLKGVKKSGEYRAEISYYLCGINEVARNICANESILPRDACAEFSATGAPFAYQDGADGRRANFSELCENLRLSLAGGFEPVTLTFTKEKYKVSLKEVKEKTTLISSFTTWFDGTNTNRVENIRLAAESINGTVIQPDEVFSFNHIVGERCKERGYLPAKIIENGEFIEGVGGGVCQVSTTIYNAALLAGMEVVEYHPHSLAVSYVPPSRDAMVSGTSCDLKFRNTSGFPVYVRAYAYSESVKFAFYGFNCGTGYSLATSVTGSIPAPEENTENPLLAREGKDGFTSECYLTVTRGGFSKTVLLRKDKYLPQKRLVYTEPPQNIEGEN